MATYHVGCNPNNNVIYAGTVNKKADKWINQSDVTEECLIAVRNHFMRIAAEEHSNEVGYKWSTNNNSTVILKVVIDEKGEEK